MPRYEYRCKSCGYLEEEFRKMSERCVPLLCCICGSDSYPIISMPQVIGNPHKYRDVNKEFAPGTSFAEMKQVWDRDDKDYYTRHSMNGMKELAEEVPLPPPGQRGLYDRLPGRDAKIPKRKRRR